MVFTISKAVKARWSLKPHKTDIPVSFGEVLVEPMSCIAKEKSIPEQKCFPCPLSIMIRTSGVDHPDSNGLISNHNVLLRALAFLALQVRQMQFDFDL